MENRRFAKGISCHVTIVQLFADSRESARNRFRVRRERERTERKARNGKKTEREEAVLPVEKEHTVQLRL